METYEFAVIANGIDPEAENFEEAFFAAGCDDATIAFQRGVLILDFAREAKSFAHAVASAIRDVRNAGATVERVEPDSLVSLSDIAKRSGLTKAAVSLYAAGQRGENFPGPITRVTTESPLWDWVQVAQWMRHHHKADLTVDDVLKARIVREFNLLVAADRVRPRRKARAEIEQDLAAYNAYVEKHGSPAKMLHQRKADAGRGHRRAGRV
jgi:hypothetical protein